MFEKISEWSESRKGLLFIICISLTLKILLFMSESVVNRDGLIYVAAAQKLITGHFKEGFLIYPMPFYPFLIGIVHFIIPDWVAAAKILSITFVLLTLVPLYRITEELFNRKAAFWACLAFTVAPVPNGWADGVIRDPGFIFCMAWAVYFSLQSIQSQRIIFFAGALVFSWSSILFRIEGIVFILFFPLYLAVLCFISKNEKVRLLKGLFLWVLFPLLFSSVFIAAFGWDGFISLNRSSDIITKVQKFFSLGFLDNYHVIYEYLINLEKYSPYPGGKQNFAEIARHYLTIIYLFGLFETLVVVLYPLFVIPLLFGFKGSKQKKRIFVMSIFSLFMFMVYYFLVNEDFIQKRFISIPALLLYPWVGAGMQRLLEYLFCKFSKRVFAAVFLIFLILPVYQCFEQEWREDRNIMMAGRWMAKQGNWSEFKVITSDARFLYYAGREFWYKGNLFTINGDMFYRLSGTDNLRDMELVALRNKMDLIVFDVSAKTMIPQFKYFKKIREFKGRKNVSYVFSSLEAATITGSNN